MTHHTMTTEAIADAGAAAENLAPEAVETPEVTAPETQEQQEAEADPVKTLEKQIEKERARAERRINAKHAQAAQARAEAQVLRDQLRQLQSRQPQGEDEPLTPERIQSFVEQEATKRAQQIATQQREQDAIASTVNRIMSEGQKLAGFTEAVNAVHDEVPLFDANTGKPSALFEAISDCDKPAAVLHYLGTNPDAAAELDGLTPTRLARKLVAIEQAMAAAKAPKTSGAPRPLTPVRPGAVSLDPKPGTTDYITAKLRALRGG